MKIGIDCRLWKETGVGRYIRNLVKELQSLDKKNKFVIFVLSRDYEEVKFQISNSKFQIKIADIRWHTIDEQLKFAQILNKENLDLMHFPYFSVPANYKKPYVITIHDLILNHFPTGKASTLPLPIYKLKRFGYKYILANAIKNSKKIIVPLNAVKEDVLSEYRVSEDKIVVTYEGVEPKVSSIKYKVLSKDDQNTEYLIQNTKYFLYVGNAYPHKNLERLIDAFIKLNEEQKRVKLFLVGKDDYFYKRLEKKIKDLGLEDLVFFYHDVTDEKLANFYKNALAFISPSLMEGFGLPTLEAMSSDCLVMVSDIPSFNEVCENAVIYFDPNSTIDIQDKMRLICNLSDKERQAYLLKGKERVKEFSWKKMTQETLKVYESSLSL